jgi:PST family polysaccharide transporter
MVAGYLLAVPYGPKGVALVYSGLMMLWIFPAIAWALRGTVISFWDFIAQVRAPLVSSVVAGGLAFVMRSLFGSLLPTVPRLILEMIIMIAVYAGMLLFVTGQKAFYLELLRGLKGAPPVEENDLIPA